MDSKDRRRRMDPNLQLQVRLIAQLTVDNAGIDGFKRRHRPFLSRVNSMQHANVLIWRYIKWTSGD